MKDEPDKFFLIKFKNHYKKLDCLSCLLCLLLSLLLSLFLHHVVHRTPHSFFKHLQHDTRNVLVSTCINRQKVEGLGRFGRWFTTCRRPKPTGPVPPHPTRRLKNLDGIEHQARATE